MKEKLAFAFALLVLCASVLGSTITGYLIDQTGSARTGSIIIHPLSTPQVIGTQYLAAVDVTLTLTNGGFTNILYQGDYTVVIPGQNSPKISVPNDTNTYNFVSLINTNGLIYIWKSPGSVVKLDGSDSTFGFLLDKISFGSFLSKTTNNFGGNESLTLSVNATLHTNVFVSSISTNGSGDVTNIVLSTNTWLGP